MSLPLVPTASLLLVFTPNLRPYQCHTWVFRPRERVKSLQSIMAPASTETPAVTTPRHEGFDAAGSLTTVFTFPPSCGPMLGDPWSQNFDCALPNWDSYLILEHGWHMQFYSPAICPEGYSAACTRPKAGLLGPEVESDETAWLCLPR